MAFINFGLIPFSFHSALSYIIHKHLTFPVFKCCIHTMEETGFLTLSRSVITVGKETCPVYF